MNLRTVAPLNASEGSTSTLVEDAATRELFVRTTYSTWVLPTGRLRGTMEALQSLRKSSLASVRSFSLERSFELYTDYVGGVSLQRELIVRRLAHSSFTSSEIWSVAWQLLDGVAAYHDLCEARPELGLPGNLFLSPTTIYIEDMKDMRLCVTEYYAGFLIPSITKLYTAAGVMPPEVIARLPVSGRTNIWVVGAILYALLTLRTYDSTELPVPGEAAPLPYEVDAPELVTYQNGTIMALFDAQKAFRYQELYAFVSCMLHNDAEKRAPIHLLLAHARRRYDERTREDTAADSTRMTDGQEGQEVSTQYCEDVVVKPSDAIDVPDQPTVGRTREIHLAVLDHDMRSLEGHISQCRSLNDDGYTALILAILHDNLEAAARLVTEEEQVVSSDGQSPLFIALLYGKFEAAKLLSNAPDLVYLSQTLLWTDEHGITNLMRCSCERNLIGVYYFASKQAGHQDEGGLTALHYAVLNYNEGFPPGQAEVNLRIIHILAEKEAGKRDLNGRTALHKAAEEGYLDAVNALLPYEAGLRDGDGFSALELAFRNKHLVVAEAILPAEGPTQSCPDKLGQTELMHSCISGDTFGTFAHRNQLGRVDIHGNTALMHAVLNNRPELIPFLTSELRLQNPITGVTALMISVEENLSDCFSLLCEQEARIFDIAGKTALMRAAELGRRHFIPQLLCVEAQMRDSRGWTALIYAIVSEQFDAARLIATREDDSEQVLRAYDALVLRAEADGNTVASDTNFTPLMYAAQNGHIAAVWKFAEKYRGRQDRDGQTALIYAIRARLLECIRLLVDEREICCNRNLTAWYYAYLARLTEVLDVLRPEIRVDPETGDTELHSYARKKDAKLEDVSTMLHMAGIRNFAGHTALMLAARHYDGPIDTNLIALEAGIRTVEGTLASHIAIEAGNVACLALLLQPELTSLQEDGFTALMLAVLQDDILAVVEHLTQAKKTTKYGHTALELALRCHRQTFVALLAPEEATLPCSNEMRPIQLAIELADTNGIHLLVPHSYTMGRLALARCLLEIGMQSVPTSGIGLPELFRVFEEQDYRHLKERLAEGRYATTQAFDALQDDFRACLVKAKYLVLPDAVFDKDGNSQLHLAALRGDAEEAALFGHLHGLRNNRGETALMLGAEMGNVAVCDFLIPMEKCLTDPMKRTATDHAIMAGTFNTLSNLYQAEKEYLLEHCEFSPLMISILEGTAHADGPLMRHAMSKTASGMTALHMAIYLRKGPLVAALAPERNILSPDGLAPWILAKERGISTDGLTPDPTIDATGSTELHRAAIINDVKLVRNYACFATRYNFAGRTALMEAALANSVEAVRELIPLEQKLRAKKRYVANGGYYDEATALMLAAASGHAQVVELLIPGEAGEQEACNGKTALMAAASVGNAEVVQLLIGVEGGISGKNGWTALMTAVTKERVDCVRILAEVEAGMRDTQGNCALVSAISTGNLEIIQIIGPLEARIVGRETMLRLWKRNLNYDTVIRYLLSLL
ncbi:Kinase, NEK [Giardia muris]|uniref:Kinase, NEK n=1 Tax=Giardia muris TaxID=5742 RepID=A0A4Z1T701_GIAMU|nr:Kinase, NEK [Giardia muris]|eukprot:TNJ29843.1 Kinase, NEK [Giardia muris]